MAATRFATINPNTNKKTLTLLLTHALLEWILLLLLLLHSLFSYSILQFSLFFRLFPPCFSCSTPHHPNYLCKLHAHSSISNPPTMQDSNSYSHSNSIINTHDNSSSLQIQHLDFCLDYTGHTLLPVPQDHHRYTKKPIRFIHVDNNDEPPCLMEIEEDDNSLILCPKPTNLTPHEFQSFPLVRWSSAEERSMQQLADAYLEAVAASNDVAGESNGNEADVSIGTEIPDLDITDHCSNENPIICNQEDDVELPTMDGMEESEKVPDTPTSVDSLNHLHNKILMLKKPDFITADHDSVDGSDLEHADEAVTVEFLKSALRAERKALRILYSELEEERSASEVAASQTMAMINRLQEEKAAVQMEALQYQRMMEEQAEYDQEALQTLNDVMVKREREKAELEHELEGCKKKLLEYEAMAERRGSFLSEDSDGVWIDLNREGICSYIDHESTPVEAIVDLEESLAEFKDERIIEGQATAFTMHDSQTQNGHSNGSASKATSNWNPRRLGGHKGKSLFPLF